MTGFGPPREAIDTSKPHSARMYDCYLGGQDHFPADQRAAEEVARAVPGVFTGARENRRFMQRVTRVLAREHGIRQWLDVGTGIPTEPNLHQVAQSMVPEARVVYADNDPLVLKQSRALMRSSSEGRTRYIQADVKDPERILGAPELLETLDLGKPVVLSLNALLHFVSDEADPHRIVKTLMDALAPGSALALSHGTPDFHPAAAEKMADVYTASGTLLRHRTRAEVGRFFDGLDLLEPGVVVCHRWRPEAGEDRPGGAGEPDDVDVSQWAGVGIKR